MIDKKAEAQNQVFIYILSIVVLSMILFFGYRAIMGFGKQTEQVGFIELRTQLQNSIKQIRSDYGSVSIKEFELPGKYNALCFAEPGSHIQIDNSKYPLIRDSVEAGTDNNVFLFPDGTESFSVGTIDVDIEGKNFGCIEAAGSKVRIKLEGLGASTKISRP